MNEPEELTLNEEPICNMWIFDVNLLKDYVESVTVCCKCFGKLTMKEVSRAYIHYVVFEYDKYVVFEYDKYVVFEYDKYKKKLTLIVLPLFTSPYN